MADETYWLNEEDEFEAQLIRLCEMHREKSKRYGARGDAFANFMNIANAEGVSPMVASRILGAKHRSVKTEIIFRDRPGYDEAGDDAFIDDAVYSVIDLVLYERGRPS